MVPELVFSARSVETSSYYPLERYALQGEAVTGRGDGRPESPYEVCVTVANNGPAPFEGVIHVCLGMEQEEPEFYLPGFLYGTNRGDAPMEGQRLCPKIRERLEKPGAPRWMVRGDRLSHPAGLLYGNGRVRGFHASPYWTLENGRKTGVIGREKPFYQYAGFTAQRSGTESRVGYTLGYENYPWLFIDAQTMLEQTSIEGQCFRLDSGERVDFTMYLYDYPGENPMAIHRALERIYWFYHEPPTRKASNREAVRALTAAIRDYAWLPEKRQYSLFVFNAPGSREMHLRELGSFSWTNGLSVAVPMLLAALRLEDEKLEAQARSCMAEILGHCRNPLSGLPFDGYMDGKWTVRGWWFDGIRTPGHTGYLVGQGVWYLLKAAGELRSRGENVDAWLQFAAEIIGRLEKEKNSEGEYPYILSAGSGAGLEYDSCGSAWCLAAVTAYMELTGSRDYLEGAKHSEAHYYRHYVEKCQCYGGPLDITKGIDSEGVLAYIRAAAALHRLTGEPIYLEHLRSGIDYELTFKFCYNSPIQVPPLSKTGWCSCGGSITSVVNPHIHPMSSTVTPELRYYVNQTGDSYIRSRLEDVLAWGSQTYNRYDREFDYGRTGWMSERFCYSQGLVKERYPDGSPASTWFALMPWAGASVVEGFLGCWEDNEAVQYENGGTGYGL